ncbi:hypothetical protein HRW09_36895, partial [Streptomyces lunaelactis]|nr:hypothetical protein [Streptomyces lunaelactis]
TLDATVDVLLRDGPPADLGERVLEPFPVTVLCELTGVPEADREEMRAWTRLIRSAAHGDTAGERAERDMEAYFAEAIAARRGSDGEDVVSLLGAAVGRGTKRGARRVTWRPTTSSRLNRGSLVTSRTSS